MIINSEQNQRDLLTWVARTTISALPIARDCLDQFLQRFFVPRLLALVQSGGHGGGAGVGIAGGIRMEGADHLEPEVRSWQGREVASGPTQINGGDGTS